MATGPKNCKCGCAPIHGYNHIAPIPKFKPILPGSKAYWTALDRLKKTAAAAEKTFREPVLLGFKS